MILTNTIIGANKTQNMSNKYNAKQNKYSNFGYYSIRKTFAFLLCRESCGMVNLLVHLTATNG